MYVCGGTLVDGGLWKIEIEVLHAALRWAELPLSLGGGRKGTCTCFYKKKKKNFPFLGRKLYSTPLVFWFILNWPQSTSLDPLTFLLLPLHSHLSTYPLPGLSLPCFPDSSRSRSLIFFYPVDIQCFCSSESLMRIQAVNDRITCPGSSHFDGMRWCA